MIRILALIIFVFNFKAYAGQIVIGLTTDHLVVWNIWENENGQLKQYLLVYNKSAEKHALKIKLKRFQQSQTNFQVVKTNKTFDLGT